MLMKSFAVVAAAVLSVAPLGQHLLAQQAVPAPSVQPLQQMPYSPSLDLTSMDRSVDPCVDFYKFTCGGWMKNNPIPADQASWSVYAKLANENQQFLWGILETDAKATNRTPVQQKVGDYFEACMNTAAIDAAGLKPIEPGFAHLDSLKTREELIAAITPLHHLEPGSFFFGSSTGQDAVDSSLMIVELRAGGLGLPDRDYYLKTDDRSVKLREQYLAYVTQMLVLSGESADKAKSDADAIMRIETALAKASLTRVERRDPHKTYHFMTIAELSQLTPSIDWSALLHRAGRTQRREAERLAAGVHEGGSGGTHERAARRPPGLPALPSHLRHRAFPRAQHRAGEFRLLSPRPFAALPSSRRAGRPACAPSTVRSARHSARSSWPAPSRRR